MQSRPSTRTALPTTPRRTGVRSPRTVPRRRAEPLDLTLRSRGIVVPAAGLADSDSRSEILEPLCGRAGPLNSPLGPV